MYDLVIVHGRIISGAGNPWFYGDVAVVGNKIVKIGRLEKKEAKKSSMQRGALSPPGS